MPNTVITSTTNTIVVVFNDDATAAGMDKGTWNKTTLAHFALHSDHVEAVATDNIGRWIMTYNGSGNTLTVDSVNSVAPTSNSDLYDKLKALVA